MPTNMISLENLTRYMWILLPDGSGYILIDTTLNKQVDGVFYSSVFRITHDEIPTLSPEGRLSIPELPQHLNDWTTTATYNPSIFTSTTSFYNGVSNTTDVCDCEEVCDE